MKIPLGKKGTEVIDNWIFWIIFTFFVAVVGLIINNIANASVEEASKIPPSLEDEIILASRFYNSDGCFAYIDEVGRAYPKKIDQSKFTQESMNKCFPLSEVKYSFSVLLLKYLPSGMAGPPEPIGPLNSFNYPTEGYPNKEITQEIVIINGQQKNKGEMVIKIKNV